MDRILPFVNTPFIKILTGIRRSGKTTIMKMLINELKKSGIQDDQILTYNFDSLQYEELKTAQALYAHLTVSAWENLSLSG